MWDKIGPPEGSLFNYPVRKQHNAVPHLAHMPAPPEIAVQIYNRGTLPTMFAKMKAGEIDRPSHHLGQSRARRVPLTAVEAQPARRCRPGSYWQGPTLEAADFTT